MLVILSHLFDMMFVYILFARLKLPFIIRFSLISLVACCGIFISLFCPFKALALFGFLIDFKVTFYFQVLFC